MVAPVVAAAAKWATVKAAGNKMPQSGGMGKYGAAGGGFLVIIGILVASLFIGLLGAIGGLLGGMSAAVSGGTAGAVAVSCTASASGPSAAAIADIPPIALEAYIKAGTATGVDWAYIAAIGKVESDHGRFGGRRLDEEGDVQPTPILGPPTRYGRAVGPMQFLTSTWDSVGKDGNFDAVNDPQNIFDAALGAGHYLKISGAPGNMRKAIFAYNHSEAYVDKVMAQAAEYRSAAEAVTVEGGITPPIKGQVSVAHANVPNRVTDSGFRSTLSAMVNTNPDFMTLNEVSGRSIGFMEAAARGYTVWREPTQAPNDLASQSMNNAVAWKADLYEVEDRGRVQLVDNDKTLYQGNPVEWDRFATWVLLKRKTDGAIMGLVSTHMMTNPEKFGPDKPKRQQAYGQGMDTLISLTRQLAAHGPVFVGGDMNTHTYQLGLSWAAGNKMQGAGFGWFNNVVDWIFFQKTLGIEMVGTNTGPTPEPDHRWLYARFAMNGAGASGGPTPADVASTLHNAATMAAARDDDKKQSGPSKQDIDDITSAKPATEGTAPGWVLPMKPGSYTLTSRWGQAGSLWSSGYHTGQDFAAPIGTPVFAAAGGNVIPRPDQASWAGSNFLTIDHGQVDGQSVITWYAHLNTALVSGGTVASGTNIGTVGADGNVTGPHLHFEVRVNGKDVDPMAWLAGAGVPDGSVAADGCGNTGSSGVVDGTGAWGGYQNGKIPLSAMCQLSFYATYLECNAAKALELLNQSYQARFVVSVGPVGGYRSYEAQVQCQIEKGNLCATPGTSNHGWGLAADLSGGGINNFGTAQHNWMRANAGRFGWVLPSWAQESGSKPEPWHWEYTGSGSQANAPVSGGTNKGRNAS